MYFREMCTFLIMLNLAALCRSNDFEAGTTRNGGNWKFFLFHLTSDRSGRFCTMPTQGAQPFVQKRHPPAVRFSAVPYANATVTAVRSSSGNETSVLSLRAPFPKRFADVLKNPFIWDTIEAGELLHAGGKIFKFGGLHKSKIAFSSFSPYSIRILSFQKNCSISPKFML